MGLENLFIVRHGESEGNVASALFKNGDYSAYTSAYRGRPGRHWNLTEKGEMQAKTIGRWVNSQVSNIRSHSSIGYFVSPFTRTLQTAQNMNLTVPMHTPPASVRWTPDRGIRERDWGDLDTLNPNEYEESDFYVHNRLKRSNDPLYWRPPGGESMVDIVDYRVHKMFNMFTNHGISNAVCVSHGEYMRATHLGVTRGSDADYMDWQVNKKVWIKNGEVYQYTSIVPEERFLGAFEQLGDRSRVWPSRKYLTFYRTAYPIEIKGQWTVVVSDWQEIEFPVFTNETLI